MKWIIVALIIIAMLYFLNKKGVAEDFVKKNEEDVMREKASAPISKAPSQAKVVITKRGHLI